MKYLVNVLDISDRRAIEKLKAEFVSMISHDLKTPLTSVQGTLVLISEGAYGDLTQKGLSRVTTAEQSLERLIKLIGELLDMDKIESGMFELHLEECSLNSICATSIEAVRVFAEQRGVTLVPPEIDVQVKADQERITQVLINLLSNAVKFSPSGSEVAVRLEQPPGSIEVQIIDKGRGIPADFIDKIFDRFQQVQKSDAQEQSGSGLGLAICKAIVEAHGGSIGVNSEAGVGSTFWFRLPAIKTAV